jgi:hypothetical protein
MKISKAEAVKAFQEGENCEKHLLDSSCLSVHSHGTNNSAPTGWIFMKLDI